MWPNPEKTADLETLTEKFHFLCSETKTEKSMQIKEYFLDF